MRWLATHLFNPVIRRLRLAGGARSMWGLLTVTGRRSGVARTTPVLPHVAGGVVVIPLSYGEGVHWLANLRAAGEGDLHYGGRILRVTAPTVIGLEEAASLLPAPLAAQYRRLRYERLVRLSVVTDAGTSDRT